MLCNNFFNYTFQDSGGFQLVSLSKFTTITEEGALFASPFTGEPTMLTVSLVTEACASDTDRSLSKPEESISIQHSIGADIIMQLDDVGQFPSFMYSRVGLLTSLVSSLTTGPRVKEAMERSVRWLDRCIAFHDKSGKKDRQNLFAIVQGGLDPKLRDRCLDAMIERKDNVAGYAVGGLSGGEDKGEHLLQYNSLNTQPCH